MSNNDLTANNNKFEASYSNGKYGFMINNTFYEIGGGGMPILDYANPLHTFDSTLRYTATKECYLCGTIYATGGSLTIKINNTNVAQVAGTNTSQFNIRNDVYVAPLKLNTGDIVVLSSASTYMHIYEEA